MNTKKLGVCLNYTQKNYGSKLQALATVKALESFGLDYEIIRYSKKTLRFILKYLLRICNVVFLNDRYDQIQKKIAFLRHPEVKEKVALRNAFFEAFDKLFQEHVSEIYSSYEELKKQCTQHYKQVLTCSDQLWSPSALGSGFYNLMFAPENMPKVSWASSFGVSNIPWYQKKRTRAYLNRIQNISVRENRGAQIVKELTGKSVPVLMDPVFAFDKDGWKTLIPEKSAEWENYIFCYFLGDNPQHRSAVLEFSKKTGMKIVTLRHLDRFVPEDELFGDYAPYDVGPERFLNILRNASFVCTDSFHGSAFSIIFEKEFIVFDRYSGMSSNSKNSRIDSLCENLELGDRRVRNADEIIRASRCSIDYAGVNRKLDIYRKQTMDYLNKVFGEWAHI